MHLVNQDDLSSVFFGGRCIPLHAWTSVASQYNYREHGDFLWSRAQLKFGHVV